MRPPRIRPRSLAGAATLVGALLIGLTTAATATGTAPDAAAAPLVQEAETAVVSQGAAESNHAG